MARHCLLVTLTLYNTRAHTDPRESRRPHNGDQLLHIEPPLRQVVCYGTFCRRQQIVPTLAAHFVAPMHNLTPGDKMCCSGTYGFGVTKCAV